MNYVKVAASEKFVALNKNGAGAGFRLVEIMFESVEKLALLNPQAVKVLVQEALSNLQSATSSKDFGVSGVDGWMGHRADFRLVA